MQIQFAHSPLHTPEQVREIMAEAAKIADELVDFGIDHLAAFDKACELLGARASVSFAPQPVDLTGLNFPFKATG